MINTRLTGCIELQNILDFGTFIEHFSCFPHTTHLQEQFMDPIEKCKKKHAVALA